MNLDDGAGTAPSGGAGTGPKPGGGTARGQAEVDTYTFPVTGEAVRVLGESDAPWFVAADVARILGYRDAHTMVRRLDEEDRGTRSVRTPGGEQDMTVISEPGLYAAILGSQVPGAVEFKRWLTREVLPAIRRTGSYSAPLDELEVARRYVAEIEARRALEVKVAELEPAAAAWDVLASASGDYSVREAAFILNRDPAISTGQGRLFRSLRDLKMTGPDGRPYASHERHLVLRARSYESPNSGEDRTAYQVRVTADGLRYLHRRLGGSGALDLDTPLPLRGVA